MNTLINGLCLGGIYALIALGYTMVYGIAKMLGAYAVYTTLALTGHTVPAVIVAVIVCTLLGVLTERVAYRPLRGASPLAVLITAIGVSYLLQSVSQLIFGAGTIPVSIGNWGTLELMGISISISSLLTLGLCVVIMVGLSLFISKTKAGTAMLAVSEDRAAASLMGINVNGIITLTFAIGSALAACASVFYLMQIPAVSPTLGAMPGIKAFTAAVIGGIGSIPGAMVGGILLGVIEKVCSSIPVLAPYTTAIEFGLLILILMVRPTGLMGKTRREKV